ncbi:resolvase/recombinase domain-containing protein [Rhizobium gallicum bv. gallicum R602sp]|uniref:Resolvase/recombinase domain-containing protein n=1 Tax=Rhizobium gallicum bv. gallicum R602sp TaxID=1041138 RepID=A0A0B4X7E8_9HYPH|nr:resolvase/recombinase domain-containing protein [Rhizobium gallicum bv. gallicum R602sp]
MLKQGWQVVGDHTDHAISGTSLLRPGIQALISDATRGRFQFVLAGAMDRLSRDQEDMAGLYERMVSPPRRSGAATLSLALGSLLGFVLLQAPVAAAVGGLEVRHHLVEKLILAGLAVAVGVDGGELLGIQNSGNFIGIQASVPVLVHAREGRGHKGLIFRSLDRSVLVAVEAIHLALVHGRRLILRGGRNGGKKSESRQ